MRSTKDKILRYIQIKKIAKTSDLAKSLGISRQTSSWRRGVFQKPARLALRLTTSEVREVQK